MVESVAFKFDIIPKTLRVIADAILGSYGMEPGSLSVDVVSKALVDEGVEVVSLLVLERQGIQCIVGPILMMEEGREMGAQGHVVLRLLDRLWLDGHRGRRRNGHIRVHRLQGGAAANIDAVDVVSHGLLSLISLGLHEPSALRGALGEAIGCARQRRRQEVGTSVRKVVGVAKAHMEWVAEGAIAITSIDLHGGRAEPMRPLGHLPVDSGNAPFHNLRVVLGLSLLSRSSGLTGLGGWDHGSSAMRHLLLAATSGFRDRLL